MRATLTILLLLLAAACDSSQAGTRLTVTGSSTVAPLFAEIARRYEEQNPGLRIDVQTGGSSRGVRDARRGLAHLGMASRELHGDEGDLRAWPIAVDGLCLIVNGDNPVASLDAEQVRAIYRGEVGNWSELGGPDREIVVVHKAEGRATLELFLDAFALANPDVRPHVVVGDNEQGIKTVAGAPGAIGYVSIGAASWHAAAGTSLRLLPHQGQEASLEAVAAGRWPILRRLNLVSVGDPSPVLRRLIDFARSSAVHDLVHALRFAPVSL